MKLRLLLRPVCHATLMLAGGVALAQGPARAGSGPLPPPAATAAAEPNAGDTAILSVADLAMWVQRHNPHLLAALQGQDAAAAAVTTAAALPNPELEAGSGQARARLPGAQIGNLGSWGISQRLENPSMRTARIEGARHGLEGSRQQVAATANELAARVRLRAYEVLLRQEEAAAAGDALALLEQIRDPRRA
jgi:cobalt-zinc-cadmium efflux system outer membrane protein